jgi:hypothetical protein
MNLFMTTTFSYRKFLEETPEAEKKSATFQLEAIDDKQKRTEVHQAIKLIPRLRSRTENGLIVIEFVQKKPVFRQQAWPKSTPYLEFVLLKQNTDTSKCIDIVSKRYKFLRNCVTQKNKFLLIVRIITGKI